MKEKARSVVVTGANGFVGSALIRRLLSEGDRVSALVREPRASGLPQDPALSIIAMDEALSSPAVWQGASAVVHLASRNHRSGERPQQQDAAYRRDILELTERVAGAAKQHAVPRFLYLSTIKAAAGSDGDERGDDDLPYAFYKRKVEQRLEQLFATAAVSRYVVLRPPLVYHADARGNFGRLVRLARTGLLLPVPAKTGKRAMIARANLVDAISTVLALDAPRWETLAGNIYEISDGRGYALDEVLAGIREAFQMPPRSIRVPSGLLRAGAAILGVQKLYDVAQRDLVIDDRAFRNAANWSPPHTWPVGIVK